MAYEKEDPALAASQVCVSSPQWNDPCNLVTQYIWFLQQWYTNHRENIGAFSSAGFWGMDASLGSTACLLL